MAEIFLKKKFKNTFKFNGHPDFGKPDYQSAIQKKEELYYFEKQREHWIEGKDGLTGLHYFYLTMGALKTVDGEAVRPYWRDGDQFVFEEYEYCKKKKLTLAIIKRREFGLTSIFAGCVPIYNALINPGSISLLTSADKPRVQTMFSEKTTFFFNNMPLPRRFLPKKLSERQDGILTLDDGSGEFGGGSKIKCLETADNVKNAKRFETERAKFIFLDEWFLHQHADTVFNSSQACMRQGFQMKGSMVIGGSCGGANDADTEKMKHSTDLVERMITDSEVNGIHPVFIPGTLCINEADELDERGISTGKTVSFMKNGISDEKKALEWIEKKRALLIKGKDKKPYYNFVRSYPLTLQEVFDINKQGILSEDIYASLSEARKKSLEENAEKKVTLRKDSASHKIYVVGHDKGSYTIIDEPKPHLTYISGTDPIPFAQNISDEGSDYAQVIYCLEEERPVAAYAKRDLDSEKVVSENILLQEWYKSIKFPNGAPTMIESNAAGVAMKIYYDYGKSELLADRPKNLGIAYEEKIKEKKGWFSNNRTIMIANNFLIANLKEYADRIRIIRLIQEASVWPNGNLDLIDAYKSMLFFKGDYEAGLRKVFKVGMTKKQIPYIGIDQNGYRRQMFRTVYIDPNAATNM